MRKLLSVAYLASQIFALGAVSSGAFADSHRLWLGGLKDALTQAFIPNGTDDSVVPQGYAALAGHHVFLLGEDGKRGTGTVARIDDSSGACLSSIDLTEPLPIDPKQFYLGSTEPIRVAASREIDPHDKRVTTGLLTYLHGLGVPAREIKIIRILVADLDGDGHAEAVVEATHPNRNYLDGQNDERADDFSGVAVGELTPEDFVVRGYVGYTSSISNKANDNPPAIFRIVALPDVQGNGKFGIAVANEGYEWRGVTLYAWTAGTLGAVENAYCGL